MNSVRIVRVLRSVVLPLGHVVVDIYRHAIMYLHNGP